MRTTTPCARCLSYGRWRWRPARSALNLLGQALEIDPEYPLALSLAGWCHAQRLVYNWTDDIDAASSAALRHAEKAAELSGDDPLILAVLGAVHTILRNHGTARIMLERAVALDPNAAWAWSRLGWLENYSEHSERAIEYFQRALRLSPLDPMNFNNYVGMASAHEVAERYDEAVALYRRGLQERPHAHWILRNLVSALVGAGRLEEAKVEFGHLCSAYPDFTIAKFKKAMVFSPAMLDRMAAHLRKTAACPSDHTKQVGPSHCAMVCVLCGRDRQKHSNGRCQHVFVRPLCGRSGPFIRLSEPTLSRRSSSRRADTRKGKSGR